MATELEIARLRRDVGATETSLPTNTANALFAEAGEVYTGTATIGAYVRVLALNGLIAAAASLTDYSQDTTTEKQSQVFDHLYKLLALWQDNLKAAVADEVTAARSSGARFGRSRGKPARIQEWPGA
jgi:hypothetical protein